jgi:hypothetical protein
MVAGLDPGHARADRLDDPCALMAEDRRPRVRMDSVDDVEIGVAHAARSHPDGNLPRVGSVDLDLLDAEQLTRLVEDRGPHAAYRIAPD